MTPLKIFLLFALIPLGLLPASSWAENKPDNKKICKEAHEQIAAIEKELAEIQEKKTKVNGEVDRIKVEFFAEQEKLRGMPHCSQGNPDNPPGCEAQLAKVRDLGDKITQLQNSLNPLGPRKTELENSIYKPKNDLILNKCEEK